MAFIRDCFSKIKIDSKEYELAGPNLGGAESVFALKNIESNTMDKYIIKIHTKKDSTVRFENEYGFLEKADNIGILEIVATGKIKYENPKEGSLDGEYCYYVSPRLSSNFKEIVTGNFSFDEKLKYFMQVCKAVKYIHSFNVIHRDLKPENILLDKENKQIKICDFGIAKFPNSSVTKKGDKLCNAFYCAPEQKQKNGIIGKYTDIYALGLMLNELFTGEIINGTKYKKIVDVAPSYGELDSLVDSMIIYNCEKRESDIVAIIYRLDKFLRRRTSKIEAYKKAALKDEKKNANNRMIANCFAEDCFSLEYLINNKSLFNYINDNYHMNIHCCMSNCTVRDELKLAAIYEIVKHKFYYESQSKLIINSFSKTKWCKYSLKYRNEFIRILSSFEYLKSSQYGDSIHFFAGLTDYHMEEVIKEIKTRFNELDKHFDDSPLAYMCKLINSLLPDSHLYNLGLHIKPDFSKSTAHILDNNLFLNRFSQKDKCEKLLKEFFPKITIVDNDSSVVVIFQKHADYDLFKKYCDDYLDTKKSTDVVNIDIEDMLNNYIIFKNKIELRLYGYEIDTLVPNVLNYQKTIKVEV